LLERLSTFRTVPCVVYRHGHATDVPCDAEIRVVTAASVTDARSMDTPERIAEFQQFLARGDQGYYGYVAGRVVHRSWLVRGPAVMRLWRRFGAWPVAAGEAYVHYCETSPEARGHGLYPAALSRIAKDAAAEGIRALFITTERDNQPSRRGIEKAGFAECASVTVRVLFGMGVQHVIETGRD
jgi:L-amino acid N-acyltransferase YncA